MNPGRPSVISTYNIPSATGVKHFFEKNGNKTTSGSGFVPIRPPLTEHCRPDFLDNPPLLRQRETSGNSVTLCDESEVRPVWVLDARQLGGGSQYCARGVVEARESHYIVRSA
jgi:hypothetical protein